MILFLPIDLPEPPKFDISMIEGKDNWWWDVKQLTTSTENPYDIHEFIPKFKEANPEFVEWVKLFPYKNIINIKIHIQKEEVSPHLDFTQPKQNISLYDNNLNSEPCGYRCILKKGSGSFYIVDRGKRIYPSIPSPVYAINHTTGIHGANHCNDREVLFFHFEIDRWKQKTIIDRSIKKYGRYVIENYPIM
jgi:hypothetical protein